MTRIRIAPSLLAADAADLAGAVRAVAGEADLLHVDVMDGRFVPNISMGPAVVEALRRRTELPLDVHLMVADPDRYVACYRAAGADWISLHVEATVHLERSLAHVREVGARAGVALNPATPWAGLRYALQPGDFVLVMSVNPGFGGQRYLPRSADKIAALRADLDRWGLAEVEIEVDGGIDLDSGAACAAAGARVLVAGSSIFGAEDPAAAARALRERAASAVAG